MCRFTLVELMLAVAISCTLAALAVPAFHEMQLDAMRAELFTNCDGIQTAVQAYTDATGVDGMALPQNPAGLPGPAPTAWLDMPQWRAIGYAPDAPVRGRYLGGSRTGGGTAQCDGVGQSDAVEGAAYSDLDGDGVFAYYACCTPGYRLNFDRPGRCSTIFHTADEF